MLKDYQGKHYQDNFEGEVRHIIPGKVFLAYYDLAVKASPTMTPFPSIRGMEV